MRYRTKLIDVDTGELVGEYVSDGPPVFISPLDKGIILKIEEEEDGGQHSDSG